MVVSWFLPQEMYLKKMSLNKTYALENKSQNLYENVHEKGIFTVFKAEYY